jgi:hypothetical protein
VIIDEHLRKGRYMSLLSDTQIQHLQALIGVCMRGEEWGVICKRCGKIHSQFPSPDDFFDVVRVMRVLDLHDVLYSMLPEENSIFAEVINKPDFIERFMKGLCKMIGVE